VQEYSRSAKTLTTSFGIIHLVKRRDDGSALLYIDRQFVNAYFRAARPFEGLRPGRPPSPAIDAQTWSTPDHNDPTHSRGWRSGTSDLVSEVAGHHPGMTNCADFGILEFRMTDRPSGIVNVVWAGAGRLPCPGMNRVCGDSHNATHGALPHWPRLSVPPSRTCAGYPVSVSQEDDEQCWSSLKVKFGRWCDRQGHRAAVIGKIGTARVMGMRSRFAGSAIP